MGIVWAHTGAIGCIVLTVLKGLTSRYVVNRVMFICH